MWHTINRVAYAVRVACCITHSNYIFIYKTAETSSRFPCMQNILQSCVADNTMAMAASAEDSQQSAGCHGWLLRQDIANETTITKTHTKLCNFIFSKCFCLSRELSLLFSLSIESAADTDIQTRLQFAKTFHLSKVCTFLDFFSHPLLLRSSFIFGEEKITESRAHKHTHAIDVIVHFGCNANGVRLAVIVVPFLGMEEWAGGSGWSFISPSWITS